MTTAKVYYECDICGAVYSTAARAEQCEDRGRPPAPKPGTILADAARGDLLRLTVLDRLGGGGMVEMPSAHFNPALCWYYFDRAGIGQRQMDHYPKVVTYEPDEHGQIRPPRHNCGVGPLLLGRRLVTEDDFTPTSAVLDLPDTVPVDTTTARYRRAWETHQADGRKLYLWVDGQSVEAPAPSDGKDK